MKRMNVALALLLGAAIAAPAASNAQMSSQSNQTSGAVGSVVDHNGAFHIDRFEKRGRKIYAVGWFMGDVGEQASSYLSPGTFTGSQNSMNNGSSSSMSGSAYSDNMGSTWSNDTLGLSSQWDTTGTAYSDQMNSSASGWMGAGITGSPSLGYNVGGSAGIGATTGGSTYSRSYSSSFGNGASRIGTGTSVGTPGSRDLGNVDALSSSTTTTGGSTELQTSSGVSSSIDQLGDTLDLGLTGSAGVSTYGNGDMGYDENFRSSASTNYDTTYDFSAAVNPVGAGTVSASADVNTDWRLGDAVVDENLIGRNPTVGASGSLGAGYDVDIRSIPAGSRNGQQSLDNQGNVALQGSSSGVSGSMSAYNSYGSSRTMSSSGWYGDTVGAVSPGATMRISSVDMTALPVTFLGASCEGISMKLGAASSSLVRVGNPDRSTANSIGPLTVELKPSSLASQGIDVSFQDASMPAVATYVSDVSDASLCEVSNLINGDGARTAIVDKLNQLIGAPITGPVRNGTDR